jgi:DNA-binding beta-propeller fold protein YncE
MLFSDPGRNFSGHSGDRKSSRSRKNRNLNRRQQANRQACRQSRLNLVSVCNSYRSPHGHASISTCTVARLSLTGTALGVYTVGSNPAGVVFDGENIWVANQNGNTVTKISLPGQ